MNFYANRFDDTPEDELITEEDVRTGKVIMRSPEQIAEARENDMGPDSDELRVFRRVSKKQKFTVSPSTTKTKLIHYYYYYPSK